jgi:acetyl-CoA synthetase
MSPGGIIWTPRRDDLENSQAARLMRRHGMADAAALRRRAAAEPDWFYPAIIEDLGIEWFRRWDQLCDTSRGLPWTDWFIGGRINLVHNVLDRHVASGHGEQVAVVAEADDESVTSLTYAELERRVCRLANALAGFGVGGNDAVGFYMPMTVDVVVGLLACLKVGAVPVPVFAGFGPEALGSRLADCGAKVLLTADGTTRGGKSIPLKRTADAGADLAPTVARVLVLRRSGADIDWNAERDVWWHEAEQAAADERPTAQLDASARSLLLYTSGTTGKPKGVVHTHAGVQVVTAKECGYHMDVRPGDTMFWLTDIGWMMGPWEILGVLFHRGTVVLLDGAPNHPQPDRIWSMIARHRVSHLALAPTAVRMLAGYGTDLLRSHDLSSVRMLGSTGEPWDEASYRWYFENAGEGRCPVINISGGTELMGCLLAPLPTEPLKPASLQGPALGMDVDVFDEQGNSIRGKVGYLVCKNAAPNMTRGFLGDPQRYLETYFEQFGPEIWSHGDWALVDDDGFWFLTGRSDDTLKIAGKRIGPGEVEAASIEHPAVREAAAVGLPDEVKGTRLALLVVAQQGISPDERLAEEIRAHVANQMGSAMRPSEVRWVEALPVTRSGKIVRGVIRRVLMGGDPGDLASVANPEAVEKLRGG